MSVKRYEINQPGVGSGELAEMDECESGGFVSYSDYAALKEENERLKPLAEIGEKWRSNSSLKEWFPYTAEELDHLKARVAELEALSADSLLSHFPGRHLQIDLYPSGGRIEATGCEECGGVESNFESVSWKTHLAQSFGFAVEKLKSKLDAKEPANEG